ncbi:lysine-rich nucleolar protein 1-like [Dreissena polymorpha]|uniref:Small acidic protein-like domain-containing protein n=1 Tax=Dreissena polymorpha TaxID=45954 RepID=A0A9D4H8I4_DREPO|nr:lysine-rich nucleolar protein 1-like [Dreissena polymorpha]XP_052277306.1 lysine-rich nucleolar protein 1-like [Dreissena polymorpha]KAH3830232.1 hypothetical protein DPMN_103472 [Dreissena polymorpha]
MGKHKRKHQESSKDEVYVERFNQELQQKCSDMPVTNDPSPEHKHKKKVKKDLDQKDYEVCTVSNLIENVNDFDDKNKKKKKAKKRRREEQTDDASTTPSLNIEDSIMMAGQEEEGIVKKKKKKRKQRGNETVNGIEINERNMDEKQTCVADVSGEATDERKKKKTKRKKKKRTDDESNEKQRKTQFESHVYCNAKTVSSNEDRNHLNTSCNLASATTVGQWGSAEFEDNSRQNKFFRLLGGLKNKDSAVGIQSKFQLGKNSIQSGGGKAMNRTQQETYAKTLETDFQKALTCNVNRGIGLGFAKPASEGKKFHIDVYQSKSIKFDD